MENYGAVLMHFLLLRATAGTALERLIHRV